MYETAVWPVNLRSFFLRTELIVLSSPLDRSVWFYVLVLCKSKSAVVLRFSTDVTLRMLCLQHGVRKRESYLPVGTVITCVGELAPNHIRTNNAKAGIGGASSLLAGLQVSVQLA